MPLGLGAPACEPGEIGAQPALFVLQLKPAVCHLPVGEERRVRVRLQPGALAGPHRGVESLDIGEPPLDRALLAEPLEVGRRRDLEANGAGARQPTSRWTVAAWAGTWPGTFE